MKRVYSFYCNIMDKLVESLRLHEEELKIIDLKYYKCQRRKKKLISFFFGR